jgi:hypothetical protein
VPEKGDTFVPTGKSIAFYSEYDENTLRSIGLAALNAGDVEPVDTFRAGDPIPNYRLSRFEDEAIAQHLASHSSATSAKLYFVGIQLPTPTSLCTTPQACARTKPNHAEACRGAFRYITEGEIFSVSCRGVRGQRNPATKTMEGSTEHLEEWQTEAKRILEWAKTEPDAAMAYYQSLTDATKSILFTSYVPLKTFAEQYFAKGGKAVPEAVLSARRYLEAYDDATFYDWSKTWDSTQRGVILSDRNLKAAMDRGAAIRNAEAREKLLGGREPGTPDESAVLVTGLEQQATALAEAVALLAEKPAEEDTSEDLAQLEEATITFMNDADTMQNLAGKPQYAHLLQSAVGLYNAGADAAEKLELHKESQDEESMEALSTAMGLVAEWAAALAATPAPPSGDQGSELTV